MHIKTDTPEELRVAPTFCEFKCTVSICIYNEIDAYQLLHVD